MVKDTDNKDQLKEASQNSKKSSYSKKKKSTYLKKKKTKKILQME